MTWLTIKENKRVNKNLVRKGTVTRQWDKTDPTSSIRSLSLQSQESVTVTFRQYYFSFILCESHIHMYNQ